ncbi:MAG: PQQ-like beta-propeller repeat protein [Gemmataceae bacterium]|nr:PQQ-like beta-propeller repeat protein [Gemmataceae bacterium]
MNRLCLLVLLLAPMAHAGDWPQFLGPKRDGVSDETDIAAWGKDGPRKLWSRDVGEGYAGPVVAGKDLIVFHRVANEDLVECLDPATGKEKWKCSYSTDYDDPLGKGNGPRATPTIRGAAVVTIGADGSLHCLDRATGKKRWAHQITKEYKVPQSYFGVGSSPLVLADRVLVNVGAKKAGIVAFALADGKELWTATDDGPSYSSPIEVAIDGAARVLFFTRNGPVYLDPSDGKVLYSSRWRARYDASVNAATPLMIGEKAFLSTSYETGALMLELSKNSAKTLWDSEEVMTNHFNTSVVRKGLLFGCDGRQEAGPSFRCADPATKKVLWDVPRFGCGTMALAGDTIVMLKENGELLLVQADGKQYRELAKATVFDAGPCRAQIAIAQGKLFARDSAKLACFALK